MSSWIRWRSSVMGDDTAIDEFSSCGSPGEDKARTGTGQARPAGSRTPFCRYFLTTSVSFFELWRRTELPGCETVSRSFLVFPTFLRRSLTFLANVHREGDALKRSFALRWAMTRLPFLIRSVTFLEQAAAVAPSGSVI